MKLELRITGYFIHLKLGNYGESVLVTLFPKL